MFFEYKNRRRAMQLWEQSQEETVKELAADLQRTKDRASHMKQKLRQACSALSNTLGRRKSPHS